MILGLLLNDKSYLREIIQTSIITNGSTVAHPIDIIDNYDDDDNDRMNNIPLDTNVFLLFLPHTCYCRRHRGLTNSVSINDND